MTKPKANGDNGRNKKGQFKKGNKCAEGHEDPRNRKAQKLRYALLKALSEKDIQEIVKKLKKMAKDGNIQAIKEVFDRCLGKPEQPVTGLGGGPIPITIIDYANIKDADTD